MPRPWNGGILSPVGGLEQQGEETRGLIMQHLSVFAKETLFFDSGQLEGDFLF